MSKSRQKCQKPAKTTKMAKNHQKCLKIVKMSKNLSKYRDKCRKSVKIVEKLEKIPTTVSEKLENTIELNITGRLSLLFFMKPKFARLYFRTHVSGGKVSLSLASFAISSRDHCGRQAEERATVQAELVVYFLVLIRSFSLVSLWN